MTSKSNYFPLKKFALNYIKENDIKNQYLFCRDITEDSHKEFYVQPYEEIYRLLTNYKEAHLYECFDDTDPTKLFLDIDYKKSNSIKFSDILNEIITLIDTSLEYYGKFNEAKIILKSCSNEKHSAHIIYPNTIFESIKQIKQFVLNLKSPLVENNIIDISIYKTGCFRMYKSSKLKLGIPLIYYKSINYNYVNDKTLYYDTLVKNISHIKNTDYISIELPNQQINYNKYNNKFNNDNNINNNINNIINNEHDVKMLEQYVFLINEKYGDNYNGWIKIGMALFNCNQTEECFNLWCNWSKQFASFKDISDCRYRWTRFARSNLTIGTIKQCAKECNPEKYKIINNYNYDIYMF